MKASVIVTSLMITVLFCSVCTKGNTVDEQSFPSSDTSPQILIVEGSKNIAGLIGMNLYEYGYSWSYACNGCKAYEMINEKTYDLILLDSTLPENDSKELLDYIKHHNIPVMCFSINTSWNDMPAYDCSKPNSLTLQSQIQALKLRVYKSMLTITKERAARSLLLNN